MSGLLNFLHKGTTSVLILATVVGAYWSFSGVNNLIQKSKELKNQEFEESRKLIEEMSKEEFK